MNSQAAERRRLDEKSCAAAHPSADREAARAAADSIAEVVADAELAEALALSSALADSTAQPPGAGPSSAGPSSSRVQVAAARRAEDEVIEIDSDSDAEHGDATNHSPVAKEQRCPACTFLNPLGRTESHCVMCGAQLLASPTGSPDGAWNCAVCTLENDPGAHRCEACDFPKDRRDWAPKRRRRAELDVQPRQEHPSTWTCELCTLVNVHASRVCSLCEAPCPLTVPRSSGSAQAGRSLNAGDVARLEKATAPSPPTWDCRQCGQQGIAHEFWMCGACGWIKDNSGTTRN
ncbi:hypothetical protein FRC08_013509 [Ceratobasidium sp. 394]|nr:hypothetical protein FRC08_013509 [Ceratobasidium sp. 394]